MATHLGRNPFSKKTNKNPSRQKKSLGERALKRVLIDLPADTLVCALKTVLLAKSWVISGSKTKRPKKNSKKTG